MFWNKEKIKFYSLIPGLEKMMPIIKAKDYKHPWTLKAQQELASMRLKPEWNMQSLRHTAKCPGIFSVQRHGWIQRAWQDFTIETFPNSDEFVWSSPLDQKQLSIVAGEYISGHARNQLADYMQNWRPDTLKTLIKIQSPWRCKIPKGYYLLDMSVPYADERRFSVAPGFSTDDLGYASLNIQLLWHAPKGKTLIKAGTPLVQYILVPKKMIDMELGVISENEAKIYDIILNSKFVRNYGFVKDIIKKF